MKKISILLLLLIFGCAGTAKQIAVKKEIPIKKESKLSEEQKLINQMSSENDKVALRAIAILGREENASKAVIEKYEDMFRNYGDNNRIEALLDQIYLYNNQVDFLPGLEVCLNSENKDIREEAVDIINDIENKKAVDVLIKALANEHSNVREEAAWGLEMTTDKEFKSQAEWEKWWKENRKEFRF